MDDRLGQRVGDDLVEELPVVDVADHRVDVAAGDLAPCLDPLGERGDRGQGVGGVLVVPAAREKLSTMKTSCPRAEKRMAVGQPR